MKLLVGGQRFPGLRNRRTIVRLRIRLDPRSPIHAQLRSRDYNNLRRFTKRRSVISLSFERPAALHRTLDIVATFYEFLETSVNVTISETDSVAWTSIKIGDEPRRHDGMNLIRNFLAIQRFRKCSRISRLSNDWR